MLYFELKAEGVGAKMREYYIDKGVVHIYAEYFSPTTIGGCIFEVSFLINYHFIICL